ncbi:hypothetical protein RN001_012930 [Aquatica leii]|uniref:Kazal-like domain-containing protein n=1 Tax=Aquatica leii TaxID=1421715 RepID=A0AAN7SNJ6_9COLE|nr:hypothetical protein RN001_012930 [Aquatica leii]
MKAALFFGALVISVLAVSSAERKICPCPRIFMPVCASNGRTYPNICEFNCVAEEQHLRLLKRSACDAEQVYE